MKFHKILLSGLLFLYVLLTCGNSCLIAPNPGTQMGGFPVTSQGETLFAGVVIAGPYAIPGQYVSGTWESDDSGAAGSIAPFGVTTDDNGNAFVNDGRVYANWATTIYWFGAGCNGYNLMNGYVYDVNPLIGINWLCQTPQPDENDNTSTHFVLPGSIPSTITSYGDFSTTYGDPVLRIYGSGTNPKPVSTVTASSVVPGSSATFAFPTQSNGSPLVEGFYALANSNVASGGNLVSVNSSYLAVGGTTALTTPYAVDVAPLTFVIQNCNFGNCSSTTSYQPLPMVTLYNPGQVNWDGLTSFVGSEPIAVKAYGSGSGTETIQEGGEQETIITATGPAYALVANFGSCTESVVQILYGSGNGSPVAGMSTVHTIGVGSQPMAITLNSAQTMAYVASYGNGSLAEISLSTEKVTRTATGVTGAQSVAIDPSGSYVWVGGTNSLYKVNLSTFEVVGTYPVSGQVTSLAASNAQNELVYTLVQNCCSDSSSYSANELSLSSMTSKGTHASASASPYAAYTMHGTLPSAATLPQATVVSAQFSNGMGASATPTGFVVYDLVSHKQIMTGTTLTPVRGIAADPNSRFAYFTLPDSNEYISVPLESGQ